jgi:hypothetical protein
MLGDKTVAFHAIMIMNYRLSDTYVTMIAGGDNKSPAVTFIQLTL